MTDTLPSSSSLSHSFIDDDSIPEFDHRKFELDQLHRAARAIALAKPSPAALGEEIEWDDGDIEKQLFEQDKKAKAAAVNGGIYASDLSSSSSSGLNSSFVSSSSSSSSESDPYHEHLAAFTLSSLKRQNTEAEICNAAVLDEAIDRLKANKKFSRPFNLFGKNEENIDDDDDDDDDDISDKGGIASYLSSLVNNQKFADVIFLVGEEKKIVYGHRSILAARSPMFANLFFSSFAERGQSMIELIDVNYDSFLSLLRCIYTDRCLLLASTVMEIIFIAKKFIMKRLYYKCLRFIRAGGDDNGKNIIYLYNSIPKIMEDERNACLKYIEENTDAVLRLPSFNDINIDLLKQILSSDFINCTELQLFQAIIKWGEAKIKSNTKDNNNNNNHSSKNEENLKGSIEELLPLIRFPLMTHDEFKSNVADSGLLPQSHVKKLLSLLSVKKVEEVVKGDSPPGIEWNCPSCTLLNKGSDSKCSVCGAKAPVINAGVAKVKYIDYNCEACTFANKGSNTACEICGTPRPAFAMIVEKELDPSEGSNFEHVTLPYIDRPRTPRMPDISRLKFLIIGGDIDANVQDIKLSIEDAYSTKAMYAASSSFRVDAMIVSDPRLKSMKYTDYHAVFVYANNTRIPGNIINDLIGYCNAGGCVCVSGAALASDKYPLGGRWADYSPVTNGPSQTFTGHMKIPTDKSRFHGLFRNVIEFSHSSGSTTRAKIIQKSGGPLTIASYDDGTPLAVEWTTNRANSGRRSTTMVLNFCPVSNRMVDNGWEDGSDGGLLLLNALVSLASKSGIVRDSNGRPELIKSKNALKKEAKRAKKEATAKGKAVSASASASTSESAAEDEDLGFSLFD